MGSCGGRARFIRWRTRAFYHGGVVPSATSAKGRRGSRPDACAHGAERVRALRLPKRTGAGGQTATHWPQSSNARPPPHQRPRAPADRPRSLIGLPPNTVSAFSRAGENSASAGAGRETFPFCGLDSLSVLVSVAPSRRVRRVFSPNGMSPSRLKVGTTSRKAQPDGHPGAAGEKSLLGDSLFIQTSNARGVEIAGMKPTSPGDLSHVPGEVKRRWIPRREVAVLAEWTVCASGRPPGSDRAKTHFPSRATGATTGQDEDPQGLPFLSGSTLSTYPRQLLSTGGTRSGFRRSWREPCPGDSCRTSPIRAASAYAGIPIAASDTSASPGHPSFATEDRAQYRSATRAGAQRMASSSIRKDVSEARAASQ